MQNPEQLYFIPRLQVDYNTPLFTRIERVGWELVTFFDPIANTNQYTLAIKTIIQYLVDQLLELEALESYSELLELDPNQNTLIITDEMHQQLQWEAFEVWPSTPQTPDDNKKLLQHHFHVLQEIYIIILKSAQALYAEDDEVVEKIEEKINDSIELVNANTYQNIINDLSNTEALLNNFEKSDTLAFQLVAQYLTGKSSFKETADIIHMFCQHENMKLNLLHDFKKLDEVRQNLKNAFRITTNALFSELNIKIPDFDYDYYQKQSSIIENTDITGIQENTTANNKKILFDNEDAYKEFYLMLLIFANYLYQPDNRITEIVSAALSEYTNNKLDVNLIYTKIAVILHHIKSRGENIEDFFKQLKSIIERPLNNIMLKISQQEKSNSLVYHEKIAAEIKKFKEKVLTNEQAFQKIINYYLDEESKMYSGKKRSIEKIGVFDVEKYCLKKLIISSGNERLVKEIPAECVIQLNTENITTHFLNFYNQLLQAASKHNEELATAITIAQEFSDNTQQDISDLSQQLTQELKNVVLRLTKLLQENNNADEKTVSELYKKIDPTSSTQELSSFWGLFQLCQSQLFGEQTAVPAKEILRSFGFVTANEWGNSNTQFSLPQATKEEEEETCNLTL